MAESTKAEFYIPLPVKNKPVPGGRKGERIASGAHLFIPRDPSQWADQVARDAVEFEAVYLHLAHAPDDPKGYLLSFVTCPGFNTYEAFEGGTLFGFLTDLPTLEQLHRATGFLINEARREAREQHREQEEFNKRTGQTPRT